MQTIRVLLITFACSLLVATGATDDQSKLRSKRHYGLHLRGHSSHLDTGRRSTLSSAENDDNEPDEATMKARRLQIAQRNCLNVDLFNPGLSVEERRSAERVVLPFVVKCLSHMVDAFATGNKFPPKCCVLDIFRLFKQCQDDSDEGGSTKPPATTAKPGGSDPTTTTTAATTMTTTTTTTKGPESGSTTPKQRRRAGGKKKDKEEDKKDADQD